MKTKQFIFLAVLMMASASVGFAQNNDLKVQTQQNSKPTEKPKKSLIGDYLSIGGYINMQYSYDYLKDNGIELKNENSFRIRRARFDVKGDITKNIEFRLQLDFAESPKVIDAFVKIKMNQYFNFQLGQFKVPFSLENPYSPLNLEAIDNAQVISALSGFKDVSGISSYKNGRDIGLMLYGSAFNVEKNGKKFPIVKYNLGVFNGNGINCIDNNNAKDYAGRLEIYPYLKELALSGSIYYGNYSIQDTSKNYFDADRYRYAAGAEYKNERLTLRSEYIWGETGRVDETTDMEFNQKSNGYYVVAGYWFKLKCKKEGALEQKIRPVLRYDFYEKDIDGTNTASTYYMAGVDYWPEKHLRFQLNYTLKDSAAHNDMGHFVNAMVSIKF